MRSAEVCGGGGVEPSVLHEVQDEFVWRDVQVSGNIQNLRDEVFCTQSFLPWDDAKAFPVYPFSVSWVCPRVFSHWIMPRTFYTGVILVRYLNYFNWFLSVMRISGPPLCPSQSSSSHPRGWAQTLLGRISFLLLLSTTSFFLSPLKVCGHFPVDWLCSSISCFTHRSDTDTPLFPPENYALRLWMKISASICSNLGRHLTKPIKPSSPRSRDEILRPLNQTPT